MLPKILIPAGIIALLVLLTAYVSHHPELVPEIKSQNYEGWQSQSAPECPTPLILLTPVDLNQVTSILYPGQERGGEFKPHGGFRFDSSTNEQIEVTAPMDAVLSDASRYLVEGEVQYTLDFQAPCGIRYRFGHLLVLSSKFATIAQRLPEPKPNNSRTTQVNPPVSVQTGEVIATAVGLRQNTNVFVDFGVYDLRGKNRDFQDTRQTAICWFDLLPPEDAATVKSLPPADSVSGSQSAYCQ